MYNFGFSSFNKFLIFKATSDSDSKNAIFRIDCLLKTFRAETCFNFTGFPISPLNFLSSEPFKTTNPLDNSSSLFSFIVQSKVPRATSKYSDNC